MNLKEEIQKCNNIIRTDIDRGAAGLFWWQWVWDLDSERGWRIGKGHNPSFFMLYTLLTKEYNK